MTQTLIVVRNTFLSFLLLCSVAFGVGIQQASAQLQFGGGGAQLEIDPRYPGPGESFAVRFADYNSSVRSELQWFINGVQVVEGTGRTSIMLTAPPLGDSVTVEVRQGSIAGGIQTTRRTVTPQSVDMIFESDTKAPYFYAGRRVPSNGSHVHMVSVPHIFTAQGERIPVGQLSFSWSIDNQVIQSGKGGASLTTTLSAFGGGMVTLAIDAPEKDIHYEKSFTIRTAEPTLVFYSENALTGISPNAIRDGYLLGTNEVTVRAEPYFVSDSIYQNAQYGWTIDGIPTSNNNTDPQIITLRKNGEGVVSDIGFTVRNLEALSQYAAGLFKLAFQ